MNWSKIINDLFEDFGILKSIINDDECYSFKRRIDGLGSSYRIYLDNLTDFNNWAIQKNIPKITKHPFEYQYQLESSKFLTTLTRYFVNTLSSAIMYVNHSVKLKNEIFGAFPGFEKVYKKNVTEEIISSEIFQFIKDIRHFTIHYGIVTFILQTKVLQPLKPDNSDSEIILDLSNIKKWKGLKSKSKRYLESLKSTTSVYTTLNEYSEILNKSYISFKKSYKVNYYDNLKKTYDNIDRLKRIRLILDRLTEHNRKQLNKINSPNSKGLD